MSVARKLIIVLGAHRSGTSLCAAAVENLGADSCLGEYYANEENRKGFFEHPDIVAFNDRLLAHLGGSWDNPLFDGERAVAGQNLDDWYAQGQELFQAIYGAAPVAVLKDPRICQLLTFWRRVFALSGYADDELFFVHTLRDPLEVALSQSRRAADNPVFYEYGRSLAEGAALWLSLTGQALAQGPAQRTQFVSYAGLLDNAPEVIADLGNFLGLRPDAQKVAKFSSEFVDRELYRSAGDLAAREELDRELPQAGELYRALLPLLDAPGAPLPADCLAIWQRPDTQRRLAEIAAPAFSRLSVRARGDSLELLRAREGLQDLENQLQEMRDNTRRIHEEHRGVLEPLREQLGQLESGNAQLQSQLAAQAAEYTSLARESSRTIDELHERAGRFEADTRYLAEFIRQMEESASWKITRPLRSLNARIAQFRGWQAHQWRQFRLRSILVYHRISLRHPGAAYTVRRLLRPVFRGLTRLLGEHQAGAAPAHTNGLLTPMLYQQAEATQSYRPLVSVIVPNFNHADFLGLRLDSIYSQTYRNFEVILLDDASQDDSAAILRDYHQRYPDKTTLLVNEQNSGGVFHQWEKGLNLASGDIVWIAESDDWCTENFLETLVPFFENEAVQVAYARTVFMDGEGEEQIWSINEYLHDIDPQRWNHTFLATGPAIVREAFALKNIIPNVSSALLRMPRRLEILQDVEWRSMRTCGDWVLYLHLLRGGMLAYSPEACNYYRIHGQNTSVGSYAEDRFYREHEMVGCTLRQFYAVSDAALERLRDNLEIHWRETRGDYSDAALERCFSLARIEAASPVRAPNLLIASYAFCSGGGETFPIDLANTMKAYGYNVSYLDCAREPRIEGVRRRLRPDIPVVSDFTQLERIVSDFAIDLVHSHHAWVDSTIFELLPPDAPCRVIVTSHGMYETINDYDLREILPRLVQRSAAIIYVADKNLEAISRHGLLEQARVERIDNALQPGVFTPVKRASLGIGEDAFVLTLVSRAMVEKGWQEAIDAVVQARNLVQRDIQLLLVGDGPEYERLARETLPGFVHLEGFQENVRGYFAAADLGFLPSKFRGESFPLVIIECLQSDRPFLASDLGEIRRMLDSDAGMAGAVVSLRGDDIDVAAVAAEIAAMAGDRERYGAAAAAVPVAVKKFDPAILARRHDSVYRSVLQSETAVTRLSETAAQSEEQ